MRWHPEVLSAAQHRVLARLGRAASQRGFYLAGGTALALRLGHRRSIDFDWFCNSPLDDVLRLARTLQDAAPLKVERTERGTLHASVFKVRVSFMEYRYPLLRPTTAWAAQGVRLASLEDIACMKLSAVAQRGSRKDFVDLFALGRHVPLARALRSFVKKYGTKDVGHVLYGLSYFDDAEREPMPRMLEPWPWPDIKLEIQRRVRALTA